jgi:hypothetical protein
VAANPQQQHPQNNPPPTVHVRLVSGNGPGGCSFFDWLLLVVVTCPIWGYAYHLTGWDLIHVAVALSYIPFAWLYNQPPE